MPLKTTDNGLAPSEAYQQLRAFAAGAKRQAQFYLTTLQTGPVDTPWVFSLLDQFRGFIDYVNAVSTVTGIDAYATSQGYTGSISADAAACNSAANACISWVVTNFPKDSTNTWLLAESLQANGTRTARNFSTAQTAGLQTALSNFIATFS